MPRLVVTLVVLMAFAPVLVHAQTPAPASTAAPPAALPVCPPTATLDQLIAAIDQAITGPAGKDRTCMKQLMLPEARLIPVGPHGPRVLTLDDWIAAVAKNGDEVVAEKQIKYQTESFGRVAHLWSTYSTAIAGKPVARGINSIQAVNDGQNWQVIEILWQAENASDPIPAQYLP